MSSVLITGASGFVGSAVVNRLAVGSQFKPRAAVRRNVHSFPPAVKIIEITDMSPDTDWTVALRGVSTVIHAAARVHVMNDLLAEPLAEFRRVNVEGTLNLARQAVSAGVTRFVFISSIKVNGESTPLNQPVTEEDRPFPVDPYGISKYETEENLLRLSIYTRMEVVIIRPPLVYGPGVKANFLNMMCWLYKGVPLPFASINNRRSLIALDNLVDFIVVCLEHPAAANQIFLVSDGEDLSTTELMRLMAHALGKQARLIPIPASLLRLGALLLGKSDMAQRLCESLQVDITKARTLLGWTPPISVNEGLRRAAQGFLHETTI